MGIRFNNHPHLRGILMWDGYPFFPLRKDFPLEGLPREMPDVAFTSAAPMEGGPFVTQPSTATAKDREPRAKRSDLNQQLDLAALSRGCARRNVDCGRRRLFVSSAAETSGKCADQCRQDIGRKRRAPINAILCWAKIKRVSGRARFFSGWAEATRRRWADTGRKIRN